MSTNILNSAVGEFGNYISRIKTYSDKIINGNERAAYQITGCLLAPPYLAIHTLTLALGPLKEKLESRVNHRGGNSNE
jgi:hypothetical protein